jgi:hypothetical protein
MTKADLVRPLLRSFVTGCVALGIATTASAGPTAVSELPRAFWGKECFGPAPSLSFPGSMWYILLRIGPDGKKIETWTTYGAPGAETKQSVEDRGFKDEATIFTSWDQDTYAVPATSPKARLTLFVKFVGNSQVQFSTANRITGQGVCE